LEWNSGFTEAGYIAAHCERSSYWVIRGKDQMVRFSEFQSSR